MAGDEFGEKTEQPTDRRRADARQKGNVARSVDLNAAVSMLAVAAALFVLGEHVARASAELLRSFLDQPGWTQINREFAWLLFRDVGQWAVAGVLPFLLLMMLSALAVNVLQVGFLVAPEVLQPKLSRLNPIEGAKRILSIRALVKLAVSLGKLLILVAIASLFIHWRLPAFLLLSDSEPATISQKIGSSMAALALVLALALIALALLDFGFQRWKHEQDLRMSKQEVREEMKNMDGDPLIRQRRREAHRKLAEARQIDQVREADVVITNPTHIAVALKYDPMAMDAPVVVAKGKGEIAERIRRIAAEHRIPIIERKELARALYRDVKVGQPIPLEMYDVFVEIMAYVYRLSGKLPPRAA